MHIGTAQERHGRWHTNLDETHHSGDFVVVPTAAPHLQVSDFLHDLGDGLNDLYDLLTAGSGHATPVPFHHDFTQLQRMVDD